MSFTAGTRLGRYRLEELIGAGGMGVVYRAKDLQLRRDVAIKVLRENLTEDRVALKRLEREARAIAALSHPNILNIHDFDTHEGISFVVMELLEGQNLKLVIQQQRLFFQETIKIASAIAEGLGAAHSRGVIHRDLKPDNIFITNDSRVKILDFGLALLKPVFSSNEISKASTDSAIREEGINGTVPYMSPEQLRGQPMSPRSDLFSFGSVFYEMVIGRPPFLRNTVADCISAILHQEPSYDGLPDPVVHIVRSCLQKDPDKRMQDADQLLTQLQSTASPTPGMRMVGNSTTITAAVRRFIAVAILVAIATTGVAIFFWKRGAATKVPQVSHVQLAFQQLTEEAGVEERATISPDGKSIAYQAGEFGKRDIFLRRVGGRNPINLTSTFEGDDIEAAFSPDGNTIAFRSSRDGGGIFLMEATGESIRRLTDFGYAPSWSPDGKKIVCNTEDVFDIMARATTSQLWIIDVLTGGKKLLHKGDAAHPHWSPHGSRIAFWGLEGEGGEREISTIPATGGDSVRIASDPAVDWNPVWSPDGRFLYFASNRGGSMNLWRVPVDEDTGKATGDPVPVTSPSIWSGHLSISQDGKLITYTSLERRSNIVKLQFDPEAEIISGSTIPVTQGSKVYEFPEVSPDGKWIAFRSIENREDIYVCKTDGKEVRKLTDDVFRDRGPFWSPDGKRIIFYSDRTGRYQFWSINADGSGLHQITNYNARSLWFPRYSPDGSQVIAFNEKDTAIFDTSQRVPWKIGVPLPRPGDETVFQASSWSPNGKRLAGLGALLSDNSTFSAVLIYSLDSKQYSILKDVIPHQRKSVTRDIVIWLDNIRLLLINGGRIYIVNTETKTARMIYDSTNLYWLSLSHDQRWIYASQQDDEGDIWLATIQ